MPSRLLWISIHALREEGDSWEKELDAKNRAFLSTPSARRATQPVEKQIRASYISIHALREEGDLSLADEIAAAYEFLSTPSARRATEFCGSHAAVV